MESEKKSRSKNPGFRMKDAEYPSEYVKALKEWMDFSGTHNFENDLIKDNLISVELKYTQLGLEYLLDSMSPKEDMAFESGSIKYVPLNPDDQLFKRYRNEILREERQAAIVNSMELNQDDVRAVLPKSAAGSAESIESEFIPAVLRIPEPPYADMCRNSPPDLKTSHLRRLREDGYFSNMDRDIKITAYLMAKGFSKKQQIDSFTGWIDWRRFQSAQGRIHQILHKTWPERFARIEKVMPSLTKRQKRAFEIVYDIDLMPKQRIAAELLGLDPSSLKARMAGIKRRFEKEFTEFAGIKRRPASWSKHSDLLLGGFYRKSLDYFRPGFISRIKLETKEVQLTSTHKFETTSRANSILDKIHQWLRSMMYRPELKTVVAGSNRGFQIEKGRFFHHPQAWREIQSKHWIRSRLRQSDAHDLDTEIDHIYEAGFYGKAVAAMVTDKPPSQLSSAI